MKLVIFDLDDTLIDFASTRASAHAALADCLQREGVDPQAYLACHSHIDQSLFSQFERGEITRGEYRSRRFGEPFAMLGQPQKIALAPHLNDIFMNSVNDHPVLFDDAVEVLGELRRRDVRTAILTNGPSDGQRRKLRSTRLDAQVDHVAIGEEAGFSKPLAQAFLAVVARFGIGADLALMVGDSPELDYDAARSAGLDAVLLDRSDRFPGSGRARIASLRSVLEFGG